MSARKIATKALGIFPKPLPDDKVKHMIVENREFLTSDIRELNRKIPINVDATKPKK